MPTPPNRPVMTRSCHSSVALSLAVLRYLRAALATLLGDVMATVNMSKKDRLTHLIERARSFTFCGPSDDLDEQTAVTTGYRYVLVQIKRLGSPLLAEAEAARLNAIDVEVDNIYTAYDARAELDALMPDIEAALARADENALDVGGSACTHRPEKSSSNSQRHSRRNPMLYCSFKCAARSTPASLTATSSRPCS